MKLFIFILFLGITGMSQAQGVKITVDHDIVMVDNQHVFKLVSNGIPSSYILYNMLNEKLAEFNINYLVSYVKNSSGNLEQIKKYYFDVKFNNAEQSTCQMNSFENKKQCAKFILSQNWVVNGHLDGDLVRKFCEEQGFRYAKP